MDAGVKHLNVHIYLADKNILDNIDRLQSV